MLLTAQIYFQTRSDKFILRNTIHTSSTSVQETKSGEKRISKKTMSGIWHYAEKSTSWNDLTISGEEISVSSPRRKTVVAAPLHITVREARERLIHIRMMKTETWKRFPKTERSFTNILMTVWISWQHGMTRQRTQRLYTVIIRAEISQKYSATAISSHSPMAEEPVLPTE